MVLLAEVLALVLAAALLAWVSVPLWIPVALIAVPLLAWIGRPDDKPILTPPSSPARSSG